MSDPFEIEASFWSGRRVFVTGHTGFKGAWLTYWLTRLGAKVYGFAQAPLYDNSPYEALRLEELCVSTFGDVRDLAAVSAALEAARPDTVLHLAAQPIVFRSYRDPVLTFETNVIGTANVLQASRAIEELRAVVVITSDKCYANSGLETPYSESDRLGGKDPYSASKACAELVTESYRESFFAGLRAPAIASARAGNVFGGGDWSEHRLIPDAMAAFLKQEALSLHNPTASRPWQFVLDAISGYLKLARACHEQEKACAEAWNFGPDYRDVRTTQGIVETLVSLWPDGAAWQATPLPNQPPEDSILLLDSAKARQRLGWTPRLSLEASLRLTVEWYRAQHAGSSVGQMRDLTSAQIDAYVSSQPQVAER